MMNIYSKRLFLVLSAVFFLSGYTTLRSASQEPEINESLIVPAWAPPYQDAQLIRYYYLPDIEVYYDVSNQEFVYLQDGSWMFSSSLPPIYAGFDLYDCFIVVLNSRVYEPWMHHHYYVAHYPRYYYHSVYDVTDTRDFRGFNENKKVAIRLKPEEKIKLNEASNKRPEQEKVLPLNQEQRKIESKRPPQRMKYYGQNIGKPVKVEKQMMKPKENSKKNK